MSAELTWQKCDTGYESATPFGIYAIERTPGGRFALLFAADDGSDPVKLAAGRLGACKELAAEHAAETDRRETHAAYTRLYGAESTGPLPPAPAVEPTPVEPEPIPPTLPAPLAAKLTRLENGEKLVMGDAEMDQINDHFKDSDSPQASRWFNYGASVPNPNRAGVHDKYTAFYLTDAEMVGRMDADQKAFEAVEIDPETVGRAVEELADGRYRGIGEPAPVEPPPTEAADHAPEPVGTEPPANSPTIAQAASERPGDTASRPTVPRAPRAVLAPPEALPWPDNATEIAVSYTDGGVSKSNRYYLAGRVPVTRAVRWLGSQGWGRHEARAALLKMGIELSPNTVKCQIHSGRAAARGWGKAHHGGIPDIPPDLAAALTSLRPKIGDPIPA